MIGRLPVEEEEEEKSISFKGKGKDDKEAKKKKEEKGKKDANSLQHKTDTKSKVRGKETILDYNNGKRVDGDHFVALLIPTKAFAMLVFY